VDPSDNRQDFHIVKRVRRLERRLVLLAARVDLVRAVGARRVWRRRRLDRRYNRISTDRSTEAARAMWLEAAELLGAETREPERGVFEILRAGRRIWVSGQSTPFANPVATRLATNKRLVYGLLAEAGLAVPVHIVLGPDDRLAADDLLREYVGPFLVKPADGAAGAGVTGEIRRAEQLRSAVRLARAGGGHVLVERQVPGDHYRVLVLDGRVLDVLHRRRPCVVGDGTSTVEALILAEYERRLAESDGRLPLKPLKLDLDCVYTLEAHGVGLDDVLAEDREVPVKTATNFGGARESETYAGTLAPELVADVLLTAELLGLQLAGVDVLTADPSVPLRDTGGAILEANAVPGLLHHYNVADRAGATAVAVPILAALLGDAA
jgi:cyanophycin synthetase